MGSNITPKVFSVFADFFVSADDKGTIKDRNLLFRLENAEKEMSSEEKEITDALKNFYLVNRSFLNIFAWDEDFIGEVLNRQDINPALKNMYTGAVLFNKQHINSFTRNLDVTELDSDSFLEMLVFPNALVSLKTRGESYANDQIIIEDLKMLYSLFKFHYFYSKVKDKENVLKTIRETYYRDKEEFLKKDFNYAVFKRLNYLLFLDFTFTFFHHIENPKPKNLEHLSFLTEESLQLLLDNYKNIEKYINSNQIFSFSPLYYFFYGRKDTVPFMEKIYNFSFVALNKEKFEKELFSDKSVLEPDFFVRDRKEEFRKFLEKIIDNYPFYLTSDRKDKYLELAKKIEEKQAVFLKKSGNSYYYILFRAKDLLKGIRHLVVFTDKVKTMSLLLSEREKMIERLENFNSLENSEKKSLIKHFFSIIEKENGENSLNSKNADMFFVKFFEVLHNFYYKDKTEYLSFLLEDFIKDKEKARDIAEKIVENADKLINESVFKKFLRTAFQIREQNGTEELKEFLKVGKETENLKLKISQITDFPQSDINETLFSRIISFLLEEKTDNPFISFLLFKENEELSDNIMFVDWNKKLVLNNNKIFLSKREKGIKQIEDFFVTKFISFLDEDVFVKQEDNLDPREFYKIVFGEDLFFTGRFSFLRGKEAYTAFASKIIYELLNEKGYDLEKMEEIVNSVFKNNSLKEKIVLFLRLNDIINSLTSKQVRIKDRSKIIEKFEHLETDKIIEAMKKNPSLFFLIRGFVLDKTGYFYFNLDKEVFNIEEYRKQIMKQASYFNKNLNFLIDFVNEKNLLKANSQKNISDFLKIVANTAFTPFFINFNIKDALKKHFETVKEIEKKLSNFLVYNQDIETVKKDYEFFKTANKVHRLMMLNLFSNFYQCFYSISSNSLSVTDIKTNLLESAAKYFSFMFRNQVFPVTFVEFVSIMEEVKEVVEDMERMRESENRYLKEFLIFGTALIADMFMYPALYKYNPNINKMHSYIFNEYFFPSELSSEDKEKKALIGEDRLVDYLEEEQNNGQKKAIFFLGGRGIFINYKDSLYLITAKARKGNDFIGSKIMDYSVKYKNPFESFYKQMSKIVYVPSTKEEKTNDIISKTFPRIIKENRTDFKNFLDFYYQTKIVSDSRLAFTLKNFTKAMKMMKEKKLSQEDVQKSVINKLKFSDDDVISNIVDFLEKKRYGGKHNFFSFKEKEPPVLFGPLEEKDTFEQTLEKAVPVFALNFKDTIDTVKGITKDFANMKNRQKNNIQKKGSDDVDFK